MTSLLKQVVEDWLSITEAAALIDRHPESLRVDAKNGLLTLTKRIGIRGRMVRLDRFNLYIKRKHGTRCKPVTPEMLADWREKQIPLHENR
jgi:hypothetical protein